MKQRNTYRFSGEVQGVGFRFSCERASERFAVAGFARNEDDGTVIVVAEGEPDALDAFAQAIANDNPQHLRASCVIASPATGEFDGLKERPTSPSRFDWLNNLEGAHGHDLYIG